MNKIGIIGAMELEVDALKKELRIDGALNSKVTQIAGMDFLEGDLNDIPVVIVRCGIGKVNAALCVQILCDHYHVTHVINTGVAGSLNAALDIVMTYSQQRSYCVAVVLTDEIKEEAL